MGVPTTIGFALAVISLVGVIYCLISNEWKVTSPLATQDSLKQVQTMEGLWKRCVIPTPGIIHCDNYSTTLFDIAAYLQVLRGLMIVAALCLVSSSGMACLSLDCINVSNGQNKMWLARGAGILALGAGIMCLASVSWYASEVVKEFRNEILQEDIKYTFGAALYIGWIASGLAFLSGSLMLCCSCSYGEDDEMPYHYKPPKAKATSEEYV